MPAQRFGSVVALGCLSAVATLGFGRLFGDSSWIPPVLLAVAGAHGLGLATRRWPLPLGLVVTAAACFAVATNVVAGHTTFYGLPTGATLETLWRTWASGLDAFRDAVAPTPTTPGLLLLSVVGTWVCATAADVLAFRGDAILTATVPPFVLYVVAATLGTDGMAQPVTFAFVVAALTFVAVHHAARMPTAWFAGRHAPPSLLRLAMGGAPVAALVALLGLVLGPALPGADAEALLELRGSGDGGDTSRITVSPLVDLKPRLTSTPPVEVFTVRSPVPQYWRLTALESFDGRIWSSRGTYRPAEGELPDAPAPDDLSFRVTQSFQIGPLDSFWLPAAYRPARVDLEGARVNDESLALLTEKDSANGLTYRVESEIPRYSASELAEAPGKADPEMEPFLELPRDFPASVAKLAAGITAKAPGPYEKALALQNHLRKKYEYDEAAPAGHGNDHLEYFLFKSKIGYCEQFAGAFAAMARSVGLPARVAVGFTPGRYDPALDVFRVTTKEAHAWPEVHVAGVGWVTFEPTPGRFEPNPTNYTGTFNPDANPMATTTTTAAASGTDTPSSTARVPDGGAGLDALDPDLTEEQFPWALVVAGAAFVVAVVMASPVVLKRRRRRRRRRAADPATRLSGAWREALDRLLEVGTRPALALTPIEFAGVAGAARPTALRPMAGLARRFTHATYSASGPSAQDADAAWSDVDALTEALDSGEGRLRRWRRRLNPAVLLHRA